MRGSDRRSGELFSDVDIEARIRANHPLRTNKAIVDEALAARIEEGFGWIKTVGDMHNSRFVGRAKAAFAVTVAMAAYALARLPRPLAEAA